MNALMTLIPIFIFILFIAVFIFTLITIIGAASKQKKVSKMTYDYVNQTFKKDYPNNDHGPSHFQQQEYQMKYARKNNDSFSSKKNTEIIKDKPLSEAERNVLNGK